MNKQQYDLIIILLGIITITTYIFTGIVLFFQLGVFFTIWSIINKVI